MPKVLTSPYERVLARTVHDGSCLRFTGDRSTNGGYGRISVNRRLTMVHRVVWEHHHGPLADDITIDHVAARGCQHRDCVNIDHLEAVTFAENMARKPLPEYAHCANGHAMTAENTYTRSGSRTRYCRECRKLAQRRYTQRKALEG
ncbi:HNH endonuclease [Nocardia ignorata]|uniref:HNH endonuclease n=3 Tax=Nocardia ignorata TaxID=145285 RepID=A0A4R6NZA4_NOCIG|nr:HNH endonuclease [Nocardia ignorata]